MKAMDTRKTMMISVKKRMIKMRHKMKKVQL